MRSNARMANRQLTLWLGLAGLDRVLVSQYTILPFPSSVLHAIFQLLLRLSTAPKPNDLPSSVVPELKLCPRLKQANRCDSKSILSCYQKSLLTKHVHYKFSVSFRYLEKYTDPNIYARPQGVPMCFTASLSVSLRLSKIET
jgi:hypothetical protein